MTTSTVQPTEANIAFARHAISHNCDGPITPFVLISRACELRSVSHETAAAALYEELRAWGWLSEESERVEVDALRDEVKYLSGIARAYKETAESRVRP